MSQTAIAAQAAPTIAPARGAVMGILLAISFSHMLNDMIQSLLPAIYPILKDSYHLDFSQIGMITLTFQITASLLQPIVGLVTDRRAMPFSLPVGMVLSLFGLLMLAWAGSYPLLLLAGALVGLGSSVFHPEAARIARFASGGRHGLAQSVFQVGGNGGQALGPLLAVFIVVPYGQGSIAWFSLVAVLGMAVLTAVSFWNRARQRAAPRGPRASHAQASPVHSRAKVTLTLAILVALVFSKFFYMASLNTFYTFYLIEKFNVSIETAQKLLFLFLAAFAVGVLIGGPVGDRIGRKYVIWASILGVLPFTLALPYVDLVWTCILTTIIGVVLASASSAIIVYAQELLPGRVGLVSGLFFGLAFGMGGVGAAVLGWLADATSLTTVYRVCAFLPAIGLLAAFLPNLDGRRARR